MDTLSQLLQATRARSPLVADIELGPDVSIGLPAFGGIPLHFVAAGECVLEAADGDTVLKAGDFVIVARLPHYRVRTGGGALRVEAMDFAERDDFALDDLRTGRDRLLARKFGEGEARARLFSAILMPGDRQGGPLTRDLPPVTRLREAGAQLEPWLAAAVDFVTTQTSSPEPGLGAVVERLIEAIFIAALRRWVLESPHERGWMRGLSDPVISRALNAMHAEPGRRWTLSGLASVSGCSRSGLAKQFHEVMGETPFAYLTHWRMGLAASALARGERSVARIAAELGYGDASAFTRAFGTAFGETPAAYRRRLGRPALRRAAVP